MAPKKHHRYRSTNGTQRPYKDGNRWVAPARVHLPDGSSALVRGTGATQAEAIDRLQANVERRLQGSPARRSPSSQADAPGAAPLTVGAWARHWLENIKRPDIRDSTYEGYSHAIDHWIAPAIGDLALEDLTVEDLDLLHRSLVDAGRKRSSWVQVRTVLKQSLDVAVERGHLTKNPTRQAPRPGAPEHSNRFLTLDECKQVLDATETIDERARVLLALSLGLRPGELLALRWSDIDLHGAAPSVSVTRTIARRKGRGLVEGPTKTSTSRRVLQIPDEVADVLHTLRAQQQADALDNAVPWASAWHVISPGRGLAYDNSNDRKRWYRLLERAGVRSVNPHGARHTAASLMIGAGNDIHVVSRALGHASIATTGDIYGHVPGHSVGVAIGSVVKALVG